MNELVNRLHSALAHLSRAEQMLTWATTASAWRRAEGLAQQAWAEVETAKAGLETLGWIVTMSVNTNASGRKGKHESSV